MGTSTDFCIEGWIYPTEAPADSDAIYASYPDTTNNNWIIWFRSGKLGVYQYPNANFTTNAFESTSTISINAWTHFAFTRSGSVFRLFINGVQEDTYTGSVDFGAANKALTIGRYDSNTTSNFNGYISNLRHVVGRAVYTSNFTPSTSSLGATSGGTSPPQGTETKLLTCQSNRFVDNASTPNTITRNGDVRVTPFSPFAPSAAYDPAVNGGSGYFDGTGDFLTAADNAAFNFGTGDFQIAAWVYPTAFVTNNTICSKGSSNIIFDFNSSGTIQVAQYGVAIRVSSSKNITLGQWSYIVASRVGSTTKIFLNGEEVGSASDTSNYTSATAQHVGRDANISANIFTGYMADFRIVKGSGVTSVTQPTAPLTAITNTSVLLNYTNAGIFDNTGKNNLETVGDAQIDTGTKKYGTGSMEFDGTGDYLLLPISENLILNSDFTIEGWLYLTSGTTYYTLLATSAWAANNGGLLLLQSHPSYSGKLSLWLANNASGASPLLVSASSLSATTWTHFAICRSGSSFKIYLNGVEDASTTSSAAISLAINQIGALSGSNTYNGFIDDLRITKGVARYTANFTAPTKAFPDQ
jgi:hypothetical protein